MSTLNLDELVELDKSTTIHAKALTLLTDVFKIAGEKIQASQNLRKELITENNKLLNIPKVTVSKYGFKVEKLV